MRMLHIATRKRDGAFSMDAFVAELSKLGELEIVEDAGDWKEADLLAKMRGADLILGGRGSVPLPAAMAADPGRMRYYCFLHGSIRAFVARAHVEAGILVSNWGDSPANEIAEGAVALLFATLKDLHAQIQQVRNDGGALKGATTGGSLEGLNLGIYGFGVIGRRFAEMVRPFRPVLRCYDPFVREWPEGIQPVGSLRELFSLSEAIAVHVGLNPQTRGSVTRELLAMLPRHGVVINTARGDVIDQEALFDELRSGRLRAGLDVLAGRDWLEPGDPMRKHENLIWTCHSINRGWPTDGVPPSKLGAAHHVCLDNVRRFRDGLPLRFGFDCARYDRST